ncbi:MAG: hypothetical protein P1P90_05885 [Patescibacteria group bacterium]|nr:hypothetical protein [Patescibacteria group bacterium]
MVDLNKFSEFPARDAVAEPEKQFGPRGTLKIPLESQDESGVYERETLKMPVTSVDTPPKRQDFQHEPKVIIRDDQKRMQELRGGMVEVVPLEKQEFDLASIETDLGRVHMAIKQAQEAVGKAETPEQRGMAMKKLTELKREKEVLDSQLPFAKKDELASTESDYNSKVKRYQELVTKLTKSSEEESEFKTLSERLPILKANLDQLKQTMAFNKEKGLSTDEKNKSLGARVGSWFKGLLGKK